MALQKTINGRKVYVRVDRVICGKSAQIPDLIVGIYENEFQTVPAQEEGAEPTQQEFWKPQTKMHFSFQFDDPNFGRFTPEVLSADGMNPIKAAYEFLKTLPQFMDYEDA